jgi:carbon-monoxide dehydrogenase medium subunit
MKPAPFEYLLPSDIDEAVSMLSTTGEAKVIAGGQSLVPSLNMRLARPERLVDISRIPGLDLIECDEDGWLTIGAAATQAAVASAPLVQSGWPLIAEAISWIGHPQIRNRGTVCGNLAHHDPSSELPALAVALGAVMKTRGLNGERTIAADDFFVSTFETALQETELLVSVSFPPLDPGLGWGIDEVTRRHGDFAIVGAAVTLRPGDANRVEGSRIVLFGVGPRPFRSVAAEAVLADAAVTDAAIVVAAAAAAREIDPGSDIHATTADRRAMAQAVVARSLRSAQERIQ